MTVRSPQALTLRTLALSPLSAAARNTSVWSWSGSSAIISGVMSCLTFSRWLWVSFVVGLVSCPCNAANCYHVLQRSIRTSHLAQNLRKGALKAQLLTWGTSAEGDDCKESDFFMNEKGPGDFGAGGIDSVLGSPGGFVGVMVPGDPDLPWVPGHPRDPDCRNNPKICKEHTQASLRNERAAQ